MLLYAKRWQNDCIFASKRIDLHYKRKKAIMGQTAVTIRMDSDLKQKFDILCNDFGMSVNTAFNVFVRTVVRTKSIPFKIESSSITKEDLLAKGRDAFEQLRRQAENNGLSSMTLDDINAEIRESRN